MALVMALRALVAAALLATPVLVSADTAPARRATPREALGQLKAGNDRFSRNLSKPVSLSVNRRKDLAPADRPLAMVLSCADSRVPPEHIFNTGLGDLLVIRAAGQVVDRSLLGSLEYGATRLQVPLLVVMGHESCDVIRAATDARGAGETPNLDYLYKALHSGKAKSAAERDQVKALVLDNVEQVVNDIMARSPLVKRLVDRGELEVVGAYYELVSGRVVFSAPVAPGVPGASTSSH
jgi:carbonic anhydrase